MAISLQNFWKGSTFVDFIHLSFAESQYDFLQVLKGREIFLQFVFFKTIADLLSDRSIL